MDRGQFLALETHDLAEYTRQHGPVCWALAMGGTRRAYLAQGGRLAGIADLEDYFQWAEHAQRSIYERLFQYGISTLILVGRVPADRGPGYSMFVRGILERLVCGPQRMASYAEGQLRVRVAGDTAALAQALDLPELPKHYATLQQETAANSGPLLIYLFRGSWYDHAAEEARYGYTLGQQYGRPPTSQELINAFYGGPVEPLTAYIGSGRPRLGMLRPPFIYGSEELYWSHGPFMRLQDADWRRILYDQIYTRRTRGDRSYSDDRQQRHMIQQVLEHQDGRVLGLGSQHELGFWMPEG